VSTSATGSIVAGISGNSPTSHFYTGLNSTIFTGINITIPTQPFKESITLMWEPKINQGQTQEKGSWIVLNSTNNITY
jgi:hypothetical protein